MSGFQQEIVARVQKEFPGGVFTCSAPQGLSFAGFRLDRVPADYFAHLHQAAALEKAGLEATTLITIPGEMKVYNDRGSTPAFAETTYRTTLGFAWNDPRVQVRLPTLFEAVYLDWAHLKEKGHPLFDNFAIRTGSFLEEIDWHNNRGGYKLVKDPQNGQHPLLNLMVGRPYNSRGLIVDVVLPNRAYPYLYCPPVMVVAGS